MLGFIILNARLKRKNIQMRQPVILFLLFILPLLAKPCLASSFEQLSYLTEEYPPLNYTENDKVTGLSVVLLNKIWQELKVKPQRIIVQPWARAYRNLEQQDNVVLFAIAQTKQRKDKFQWACPIENSDTNALIALKSSKIKVNSFDELSQYAIGTVRYDIAEQVLMEQLSSTINIFSNVTMKPNLELMAKGRIQMIAYDLQAANNMIIQWGGDLDDYETVFVFPTAFTCFAFSKGVDPALVQQFQQALTKIFHTDEYQQLLQKFYSEASRAG
ncbi:transporter substrate-binding domain-containing protein [Thalassomonas viridans]|uniref:Transporter substrate-binding domain-containing protein n=1 Tax=Thalassomonas viridans TaxID=137584 RepID=A0AAE9Z2B6_9GAMM|nr:transporter substrate-binding domain-containing protein [Thalassomonas viridans]WDE05283.1 transporter substrate-binding domain-containing protein [Thalassomonas viridans]